jgi:hypothetical protein
VRRQHVAESVLADQQDQRRRRAHDGLGPQPRDLALDGAFQTDDCRQPKGGEELDEVPAALHGATE